MMLQWTLKPRKVGTRPTNYCEMVEISDQDQWPVAIVMTDCFDEFSNRLRQGETITVRLEEVVAP